MASCVVWHEIHMHIFLLKMRNANRKRCTCIHNSDGVSLEIHAEALILHSPPDVHTLLIAPMYGYVAHRLLARTLTFASAPTMHALGTVEGESLALTEAEAYCGLQEGRMEWAELGQYILGMQMERPIRILPHQKMQKVFQILFSPNSAEDQPLGLSTLQGNC